MTFKEFREHKLVKFLSNRYVLIFLIFLIWMIFIDQARYINHLELDAEINKLEKTNKYYKDEIDHDKKILKNLEDPDSLEKFARETYKMKKKDEDIFLIEFDSVKN